MKITNDWHIHSRHSCDGACMEMADLVRGAPPKGIADFGITDHIHTPYNLPDLAASREAYLATEPDPRFHFGVEVSCVSQWEIDEIAKGGHENPVYGLRQGGPAGGELAIGLDQEDLDRCGVEFVVGGTHWPMYVPLEREAVIGDYHRQNMFLATHPLVDIVAHPWWWMGHWKDDSGGYPAEPWFDDFGHIPQSMHDELAAAAIEHETCVEINLAAILLNRGYPEPFKEQYLEYVAGLKAKGTRLCVGSDCHSAQYDIDFETPAQMLERVEIVENDLWGLLPTKDR